MMPAPHFPSPADVANPVGPSCAICIDCDEDTTYAVLLPCRHEFHESCMMAWLYEKSRETICPMCRAKPNSFEITHAAGHNHKGIGYRERIKDLIEFASNEPEDDTDDESTAEDEHDETDSDLDSDVDFLDSFYDAPGDWDDLFLYVENSIVPFTNSALDDLGLPEAEFPLDHWKSMNFKDISDILFATEGFLSFCLIEKEGLTKEQLDHRQAAAPEISLAVQNLFFAMKSIQTRIALLTPDELSDATHELAI